MDANISYLVQPGLPLYHLPDCHVSGTGFLQVTVIAIPVLFQFGKVRPGGQNRAIGLQIRQQRLKGLVDFFRQTFNLLPGRGL
jgi:hypothetical protein